MPLDRIVSTRLRFLGFFFFQAEDGIRDLVRSRGLGDVYKRQKFGGGGAQGGIETIVGEFGGFERDQRAFQRTPGPVSYTHLTLPTSDLV